MADVFVRIKVWLSARSDRGASLVEYALLLALIAMVCFVAIEALGGEASSMYEGTGSSLGAAN